MVQYILAVTFVTMREQTQDIYPMGLDKESSECVCCLLHSYRDKFSFRKYHVFVAMNQTCEMCFGTCITVKWMTVKDPNVRLDHFSACMHVVFQYQILGGSVVQC